ncbi:anti-sigma factor family protein [Streptomyces sp. 12297]
MTSTTGTIRHPDVSEISDLTEGLLSPARTAEVREHLITCALCADVRTSLEEIRGLLGTLPGHQRMPADIAGRIDAALAAEALLDATSPEARRPEPAPAPHTPAPDVSRETSLPATAAVPKSGPATTAGTGSRPPGRPRAATGPGRTRGRRGIAVLGALTGAAVCALGIFLSQTGQPSMTASDTKREISGAMASAIPSTEFTAAGLEGTVQQLLGGQNTAKSRQDPTTPQMDTYGDGSGDAPRVAAPTDLPPCVSAGTGRTETPLAAEHGTYRGTEVYLLVLAHPGDTAKADAYLVDATCENSAAAGPGKVLLKGSYPRH